MNARWGGGEDTVFLEVSTSHLYSYNAHHTYLHGRYGGKLIQTSRSGKSGAGELPLGDNLIQMGWYRTDVSAYQQSDPVEVGRANDMPIYGWAPIATHRGITDSHPVVLSTGDTVAYVSPESTRDGILEYNALPFIEVATEYGRPTNSPRWAKMTHSFANPYKYSGVNMLRFAHGTALNRAKSHAQMSNGGKYMFINSLLGLVENGGLWWHKNKIGFFDEAVNIGDIHAYRGDLPGGWVSVGDGFFYRRRGPVVDIVYEVLCPVYKGGTEKMPTIAFFAKGVDAVKAAYIK